ncbi:antA/AntB antirepressor family protein [Hymenobacter aerilatus]|uniref:AntA/AntB antirepressor family protein n=1 Tax=Hymenobacter aerilatus TaxID=2932251 RepID=A0A8T9SYR0_9BACT|nr:phage antirepressor KilAC domain-containing protein [Hymenobacter aerilatus]UOR07218.1 antA/AntB antirepressor family protein [Hymenobacter aerilatus]
MEDLNPIQKSEGGRDVVSARLLYAYLEVSSNFTTWFNRRVEEYGFQEKVDFIPFLEESTGGRQAQDFVITLSMAKELSMVEKTPKGQEARRYFIECEQKLRSLAQSPRPLLPTTYKEAVAALLSELEAKEKLEHELALAAPAVAFTKLVSDSEDLLTIGELAKTLNIPKVGRNTLFRWLRRDGYLMKNNLPYQKEVTKGLFKVKQRVLGHRSDLNNLQAQTMVTGKGAIELTKRYKPADSL